MIQTAWHPTWIGRGGAWIQGEGGLLGEVLGSGRHGARQR
jgi:hypothetical protein